ncbi:pentatricopeptide repeat-containing family protein [Salix suchowensis]|nr:pentatricopeptide repeat-containing family protein [Salix suchowensis]
MVEIGKTHPFLLTLKSMSIMLCRIAKFRSYEETLDAFEKMEKRVFVGRKFGVEEFNVLLRAFCTVRKLKEAKSVFVKMHERFPPNLKTMNILLLGFKESRDITAMELFYHEMVKRGFKPSCSSYGIRIDAYCKKGYFADALRIFQEMEKANCLPTLETVTTLIHGAGVARNAMKARELFDKIPKRNFQADTGAYNALISSLFKCRDLKSAIQLMDEMEKNNIHYDDMTYHTMFLGLMKSGSIEGVCELYHKMIDRNFVPKTRTVVMLMKFFCVNSQIDLGLCSRGRSHEALKCSKQSLERGIHVSEAVYRMLERFLLQSNMTDKLRELNQMIEKLQSVLPPSSGNYIHSPSSAMEEDVVD